MVTCVIVSARCLSAAELCLRVADEGQQPLPAARVHVVSLGDGQAHDRQTDANGSSCLSGLPEGLYSVEASLQGFLHVRYYPVRVSYSKKKS
jgi:hypothetical protein